MKSLSIVVFAIILMIVLLTIAPLAAFWAVNALFAYSIPLTWKTWLAFWVLAIIFGSGGKVNVK